jgi:hypothetical protein
LRDARARLHSVHYNVAHWCASHVGVLRCRSTQYGRPEGCALIFAETNAAELTDASNDVMSCEQSAARHVATPRLRTACVAAGAARACHTAAKCAAAPRNTSRAVLHASTTMLRRRARRARRRNERRGAAGCTPHCRTAALEPRHGILHALGFRQLDCIYVQVVWFSWAAAAQAGARMYARRSRAALEHTLICTGS